MIFLKFYRRPWLIVLSQVTKRRNLTYEQYVKKKKARAKIRFNSENLKLFGPLLYPVKINQEILQKINAKGMLNTEDIVEVREHYFQAKQPDNRGKSCINYSTILGNTVVNQVALKNLRNSNSTIDDFASSGVLDLFISNKKYQNEFPFNQLGNYTQAYLRSASLTITGVSNVDELDNCLPSICSILQTGGLRSDNDNSNNNLKIISEYGLATIYAHHEEMYKIETHLHKAMRAYFNGTPITEINPESPVDEYWKSLSELLPDISDVNLLRTKLMHPYLFYEGFIDYIGKFRDHPSLIEVLIPHALLPSSSAFLVGLRRAVANLGIYNAVYDDNKIMNILLIIVTGNAPARVFSISKDSCEEVWKEWIDRLQAYWEFRRNAPFHNYVNVKNK